MVRHCFIKLSYHWLAISPSEVSLKHLVVEAKPLVVTAQTCRGKEHQSLSKCSKGLERSVRRQNAIEGEREGNAGF